LRQVYNW